MSSMEINVLILVFMGMSCPGVDVGISDPMMKASRMAGLNALPMFTPGYLEDWSAIGLTNFLCCF